MNIQSQIIYAIFACCVLVTCHKPVLFAQTSLPLERNDNQQQQNVQKQERTTRTYIGWGLNYTLSDISPYPLNLSISAFGAQTITPFLELAFTLHLNQSSISQESKGYHPVWQTSSATFAVISTQRIAYSVSGDVTLLFSPFALSDTDWRNLRIGVGPSARVAGMMLSTNNVSLFNGERLYVVRNTRQHSLGGHIVLEYLFPLSSNVDIALRGQAVVFAPSLYTIGDTTPIASWSPSSIQIVNTIQTISLGAFLRIGF